MFTVIKWLVIFGFGIWVGYAFYPRVDSVIDVKSTTSGIAKSVHDGIRSNQKNDDKNKV